MPNVARSPAASTRRSSAAGCSSSRRSCSGSRCSSRSCRSPRRRGPRQPTTVAVVASDAARHATATRRSTLLNRAGSEFELDPGLRPTGATARGSRDREIDAAIVAIRRIDGSLAFSFHLGETMGQPQIGYLSLGVFGVAVLDYAEESVRVPGPRASTCSGRSAVAGRQPGASTPRAFASRLIVGIVFVVLIFMTIVIYGMWVARASSPRRPGRVMELLISAATTRQLVIGKTSGSASRAAPR